MRICGLRVSEFRALGFGHYGFGILGFRADRVWGVSEGFQRFRLFRHVGVRDGSCRGFKVREFGI